MGPEYKMWENIRGGTLEELSSDGENVQNCNKPNHFARMCGSQQINDVTDGISISDKECNLIRCSDSCDDFFQPKVIKLDDMSVEQIENYFADRMKKSID